MFKYFLLLVMAWLSGIPGAGGLFLLGLYFLAFVYTTRYRGHYGRLSSSEKNSLILKSDVDKFDMRSQWDVFPWPRTAKHVIRKWTWDRIALDTQLKKSVETTSTALTKAYTVLEDYIDKHPTSKIHPYSGTLAVFDSSKRTHTPDQAFALVKKNVGLEMGWTDQAICLLGGSFIICAESYKDDIRKHFKENNKKEQRMKSKTNEELSRFTWKVGQLATTFSFPTGVGDFIHSALIRISPWDRHAVVKYGEKDYYAPTTMFGASATIMKVLKFCETLGLDQNERMFVGYSVAMHWLDKYLNDASWIRGGILTPDRHSLLEALQGMYAYIDGDPTGAAKALVQMYEEADTLRLKDKEE
ncbi:hypothetical protein [Corallococcus silvisoli]|uniref:hypothetical protein n=1 Tax=Corallococcus silvisoli TaxID=2697031 RepID=UPI001378DFA8|nr:hypothetical protein [Corallococcus silvisoli]NBD13075.1 hypothetical protein [Corallococcus silvisoli]